MTSQNGTLAAEVATIHSYWHGRLSAAQMTPGTVSRYERVLASFARFAQANFLSSLTAADMRVCQSFISAPRQGGFEPAASTSRFRLTVIRDAYLGLVLAGFATRDPSVGLRVIQRPQIREIVPLTPVEVGRLRTACRVSPRDHLRPATVELALLGGSHLEIAETVVADLNLANVAIRLGGRWRDLDAFASATFTARIAVCRRSAVRAHRPWNPAITAVALARPLSSYPETSVAPSVSSSLSRAMASAGITRAGVRPASVREYAANRHYVLTGSIEAVADFLGLESLDVARGFISPAWQAQFAKEVRTVGC